MSKRRDPAEVFGKIYEAAIQASKEGRAQPNTSGGLPGLVARCRRILTEAGNPTDPPPSTPGFYAKGIVGLAQQLEAERKRCDIDAIIDTAMTIGMVLREFALSVKHGGAVAFYAEQASVLSAANAARTDESKAMRARWQADANRVWEKNPRLSRLDVAKKIAAGANIDTVRKAIRKPGK
jgi:hypothetical protein